MINSSPNDKISDWSKSKTFANEKLNLTERLNLFGGRLENIVGKGENAGHQHFFLFQQCFQKASFGGLLNVMIFEGKGLIVNKCYNFSLQSIASEFEEDAGPGIVNAITKHLHEAEAQKNTNNEYWYLLF